MEMAGSLVEKRGFCACLALHPLQRFAAVFINNHVLRVTLGFSRRAPWIDQNTAEIYVIFIISLSTSISRLLLR